jgi:hypothetical protein
LKRMIPWGGVGHAPNGHRRASWVAASVVCKASAAAGVRRLIWVQPEIWDAPRVVLGGLQSCRTLLNSEVGWVGGGKGRVQMKENGDLPGSRAGTRKTNLLQSQTRTLGPSSAAPWPMPPRSPLVSLALPPSGLAPMHPAEFVCARVRMCLCVRVRVHVCVCACACVSMLCVCAHQQLARASSQASVPVSR